MTRPLRLLSSPDAEPMPLLRPSRGEIIMGLLENWITSMQARGLSHRTIERADVVRRCAAWAQVPPETLTAEQINDWLADHHDLKRASRATYLAALRAWHRWLVVQDHRGDDPTIRVGRISVPRGKPRPIRTVHLDALMRTPMWPATRMKVLLHAYQGLRVHEIAAARGEWFDLLAGELTLTGKGEVEAVLPLHPLVGDAAAGFPHRGLWFPSPTRPGQPVHPASVSRAISEAMRRAGVRGSAHQLRHWFATELLAAGADMRETQELCRHASATTTAIYTAVGEDRLRRAILRLPRVQEEAA